MKTVLEFFSNWVDAEKLRLAYLARKLQISKQGVADVLNRNIEKVSIRTLRRYANALGLPFNINTLIKKSKDDNNLVLECGQAKKKIRK